MELEGSLVIYRAMANHYILISYRRDGRG